MPSMSPKRIVSGREEVKPGGRSSNALAAKGATVSATVTVDVPVINDLAICFDARSSNIRAVNTASASSAKWRVSPKTKRR